MTVRAKAEKLNISDPGGNGGAKLREVCLNIAKTLGDIGVLLVNIYAVKKICVHEIAIALIMLRCKAHILVKIHGADAGKIQTFDLAAAGKLIINSNGT